MNGRREGGKEGDETFVSKDGGASIAKISVDELPGNNLMAVESLAVGEMGVRLAGVGRRYSTLP